MRIVDTTKRHDVWRILRRARSIHAGMPRQSASIDAALSRAARELGLTINELAWARASVYRVREQYPTLRAICLDDMHQTIGTALIADALGYPWAPGPRI